MEPRMTNPAMIVPNVFESLQKLTASMPEGLPQKTIDLVHLRASQINGCAVCADMHSRGAKKRGETDERLYTLAAWREAPYFTDAERAALALTEALTRIADHPEAVSDDIFNAAAKHYDEASLAALVVQIAAINTWNRINVATRQIAGEWTSEFAG
jgi:AhpD family alkylhydroperoxidase